MEVFNPIGTQEIAPTTATAATIPSGTVRADIAVRSNPVVLTTNGDTPDTSNTGMELQTGTYGFTVGNDTTFTFLDTAAGASNIYITYYAKQVV